MKKFVSRRELLSLIAKTGASAAVLKASSAMGLVPDTQANILDIPSVNPVNKPTVVILGAGISGLTVAYELDKAGYDCVVLEAAPKAPPDPVVSILDLRPRQIGLRPESHAA